MNSLFHSCLYLSLFLLTMLDLHSVYKNQKENVETNGCQAGEAAPLPQRRLHSPLTFCRNNHIDSGTWVGKVLPP